MTPEKVREILKISQEPVSLESPIGEEDDSHLGDFIADDGCIYHHLIMLLMNCLKEN